MNLLTWKEEVTNYLINDHVLCVCFGVKKNNSNMDEYRRLSSSFYFDIMDWVFNIKELSFLDFSCSEKYIMMQVLFDIYHNSRQEWSSILYLKNISNILEQAGEIMNLWLLKILSKSIFYDFESFYSWSRWLSDPNVWDNFFLKNRYLWQLIEQDRELGVPMQVAKNCLSFYSQHKKPTWLCRYDSQDSPICKKESSVVTMQDLFWYNVYYMTLNPIIEAWLIEGDDAKRNKILWYIDRYHNWEIVDIPKVYWNGEISKAKKQSVTNLSYEEYFKENKYFIIFRKYFYYFWFDENISFSCVY